MEVHANFIVISCLEDSVTMEITANVVSSSFVITSLPYAMPTILLHILDVHDKSFLMLYSLYRISTAGFLTSALKA